MNILKQVIILLVILILVKSNNINCVTGHKILVRETIQNNEKQKQYKLIYKCLCPNNYYGNQCAFHMDISCYLNSTKSLKPITQQSLNNLQKQQLQFSLQCWVRQNFDNKNVQLRQYLSKFNKNNQYGVRQRFGKSYFGYDYEIIWANTTDIFDDKGQLKIISDANKNNNETSQSTNNTEAQSPTKQEIMNVIIGNNTQLQNKPFTYKDEFLGFGLINGNISYNMKFINPTHGKTIEQVRLSNSQVKVEGLQAYINSFEVMQNITNQRDSLVKNITDQYKKGGLDQNKIQSLINQYLTGQKDSKQISDELKDRLNKMNINLDDLNKDIYSSTLDTKTLPKILTPVKLNPYTQTFYQNIFISLSITEHYQDTLKHDIGLNSLTYNIPVKINGVGSPIKTSKQIIVTDESNKSYYKILFIVFIIAVIFFLFKYGHNKYQLWKNKQYTTMNQQNEKGYEQKLKSTTFSQSSPIKNKMQFIQTNSEMQRNQEYQTQIQQSLSKS